MGNVPRRRLSDIKTFEVPKVKVPMVKVKGIDYGDIPKLLRRYEMPIHCLPKRLQELYRAGKLPKDQYVPV